jgi:hypothetical protein
MGSLLERYADRIVGCLSCYDRVLLQGTLPKLCYAQGMGFLLHERGFRIFDYAKFAQPLTEAIRANAERVARENGIAVQFVAKTSTRKDDLVATVLAERGDRPGLVAILSAMEGCTSYRPWHNKNTGFTDLKATSGKCLHYYFYFIDEALGLCFVRVPTWCPFRLQFYFNGHSVLARKLDQAGIAYKTLDNAFAEIADFEAAQRLADDLEPRDLHQTLDRYAKLCCPVIEDLGASYHWSLMQVEYSTDVVFRSRDDLQPIYETLVRTAIHAVKPDNVACFLGRKSVHGNFEDELGTKFETRIQGTRIKHHMGPVSIKMYDKFGQILRIETTATDVSFFRHYRKVEHRDGSPATRQIAPLRKTIYSLPDLRGLLTAANRRYLDFLSALDDPSVGMTQLRDVSETTTESGRSYKGFNFFSAHDDALFQALARGENVISGVRNKDLRRRLGDRSSGWTSRCLKRLRVHGLIRRMGRTYKYYLTDLGRRVVLTGLKLKEMMVIPALAAPA